jgi:hypothetical protein
MFAQDRCRALDSPRGPAALLDGADKYVFGNTAGAAVYERLKLLDVGVTFAPIAK